MQLFSTRQLPSNFGALASHYWEAQTQTTSPCLLQVCLCEDASVLGTPFYLMQHVRGRIFADPSLPGVDPPQRAAIYEASTACRATAHRGACAAGADGAHAWSGYATHMQQAHTSHECYGPPPPLLPRGLVRRPWRARWPRFTACPQRKLGWRATARRAATTGGRSGGGASSTGKAWCRWGTIAGAGVCVW